jgi:hypothetical protein
MPALTKAKSAFPSIQKTKTANIPGRSYNYADISVILAAITPSLTANGLAIMQDQKRGEHSLDIQTTLYHESGEWIQSEWLAMPLAPNANAHAIGSASTYGRRYSLSAFLGLATEDDDDGHEAASTPPKATTAAPRQQQPQQQRQQPANGKPAAARTGNVASAKGEAPKPVTAPAKQPPAQPTPETVEFYGQFEEVMLARGFGPATPIHQKLCELLAKRGIDANNVPGEKQTQILGLAVDGDLDLLFEPIRLKQQPQQAAA